jgi:DnaJ-class molecular chaperone
MTENHEIECPECDGNGWIAKRAPLLGPGVYEADCDFCGGHGWREMTDDEAADYASDAFSEMCESEPPLTMIERRTIAWNKKRELRA